MKNADRITALVALMLVGLATPALATETVSPGAFDRLSVVETRCPTFSWGEDDDAAAYELVAYLLPEDMAQHVEFTAETEVMYTSVAGSATSWTPSAEQCFAPGGRYVWFVRAVTELVDDEVIEAGEWSVGRYFTVPAAPSPEEMQRALEVIRRWEATNGGGSLILSSATATATVPVPGTGTGSGSAVHRKSVQTPSAAIRGEHPDTSGEVYGLVGTSASVDGAGVAAANLNGGPDLVLDGITNGETDTALSEAGIDRASPNQETFTLHNSGPGRIDFEVIGDVYADTIDIEEIKIAGSTLVDETGEWKGLGSSVPCNSCVGSSDITDGQVGAADLAPGAVTETRLRDDAVTSAKIADGTITRHDLGTDSVGSAAIADGSITEVALANGAVTGAKIADGEVSYRELAVDSVRGSHIRNGDVGTAELTDGAVTSLKIGARAVNEGNLQDWAVSAEKIEPGAVTENKLADGAVWGAKIADNAVGSSKIATNAVKSSKVLDGTLTAADMDPLGGVYASKSAVYEVETTASVSSAFCNTAIASCADSNDLPLSWFCIGNPGVGLRPISLAADHWNSTGDAASFSCTYCNDSSSTQPFEAHIICVSVPGS